MMMVSRDPYKPPTIHKAPPMTAAAERKRTYSMNRVNSAKTAGSHPSASGQGFYNRAVKNQNQYHAAQQLRQSAIGSIN